MNLETKGLEISNYNFENLHGSSSISHALGDNGSSRMFFPTSDLLANFLTLA